jgi:hypothetical protein
MKRIRHAGIMIDRIPEKEDALMIGQNKSYIYVFLNLLKLIDLTSNCAD